MNACHHSDGGHLWNKSPFPVHSHKDTPTRPAVISELLVVALKTVSWKLNIENIQAETCLLVNVMSEREI